MNRAWLLGEGAVRLWGLDGATRFRRQFASLGMGEAGSLVELAACERALIVDAEYVIELRGLKSLVSLDGLLVLDGQPVAASVPGSRVDDALAAMAGQDVGLARLGVADLDAFEGDLRKAEPPLVARVTPGDRDALESRLYGAAYKGVTDFVTKWWWPRPARVGVRVAASLGLTPNMVTLIGFLLMLFACWAFLQGNYVAGLVSGWIMTWLDTVDGKLARVTVQSSQFGHLFDHGIDLLHPPFWYWCWGLSLADWTGPFDMDASEMMLAIVAGYVGGRVAEGAFHLLGPISLFAWRPFDAWFRLITARRNPCLVLLTLGWAAGAPDAGFVLVAAWTVVSTGILILRLLWAVIERVRRGPLQSWLAEPDARTRYPRAYATFSATRGAYA